MNYLESIHWLDVTIVAILVVGTVVGAWRGVLLQTVRLMTYVVSFYAAVYLHAPVVTFLQTHLKEVANDIPRMHSFLGTMLGVYMVTFTVTVLFRRGLKALFLQPTDRQVGTMLDAVGLRPLDRLLGAGLGLIVAGLLTGGALLGLTLQADERIDKQLVGSQLRAPMLAGVQSVLVAVPKTYKDELTAALQRLQHVGQNMAEDMTTQAVREAAERAKQLATGAENVQHTVNNGTQAAGTGKDTQSTGQTD